MTRVKGGIVSKNRRRKVLKRAKGYFGSKHRLYKTAQEQLFHSGAYSYQDRKKRSSDFRKLWITRINAACRENEISYSQFINGLTKAGVEVNRKMLSAIAIDDPRSVFLANRLLVIVSGGKLQVNIVLELKVPLPKLEALVKLQRIRNRDVITNVNGKIVIKRCVHPRGFQEVACRIPTFITGPMRNQHTL